MEPCVATWRLLVELALWERIHVEPLSPHVATRVSRRGLREVKVSNVDEMSGIFLGGSQGSPSVGNLRNSREVRVSKVKEIPGEF